MSKEVCRCPQNPVTIAAVKLFLIDSDIGIDIKNAETFFKMLVELQGEDTIDASTFANACVRMKGAATSIDLQTVMFTTHLMNKDSGKPMHDRLSSVAHTVIGNSRVLFHISREPAKYWRLCCGKKMSLSVLKHLLYLGAAAAHLFWEKQS